MKNNRHLAWAFVLASLITLEARAAAPTTTTTTFNVSSNIASVCSVAATALAFGTYNPFSATALTATSTITGTCTTGTAYLIGMDQGANGTSTTNRQMINGTSKLNYSLYSDSARSVNWGNTVGTDTFAAVGNGVGQAQTVYGKIPVAQTSAPIGNYTDTITVTVSY